MNLLFEHGCIITENPQEEVIRDGWLLVSEGKILGLGEGITQALSCRIDGSRPQAMRFCQGSWITIPMYAAPCSRA